MQRARVAGAGLMVAAIAALSGCAGTPQARPPPNVLVPVLAEPAYAGPAPQKPEQAPLGPVSPTQPPKADPDDPLSRPVSLHLERQPLGRALSVLSLLSDIDVLVPPEVVAPAEADQMTVTLRMRAVTVRAALDWLTRMLHAHYRALPGGVVRLYRQDDWILKADLVTRSYRSGTYKFISRPAATSYDQSGVADGSPPPVLAPTYDFASERQHTLDLLYALLGYVERRCKGSKLLFDSSRTRLVALQPEMAHGKIAAILAELDRWRDHSLPPARRTSPWLQRTTAALAAKVSCDADQQPFDQLIGSLAAQAKVNIGWNTLDREINSRKAITLKLDEVPLAQALNRLMPQAGLAHFQVEPGHGLWLLRQGDPPVGQVPEEFFWDACVVRSYYIAPLLSHRKLKELLRMIQVEVTPKAWKDGPPAMACHAPTQRLVVLHTPAGQDAIARYLRALAETRDTSHFPR